MNWRIVQNGTIALIAAGILYTVIWLYDTALRDPRTFDGWVLFGGITFQVFFSWRRRFAKLPLGRVTAWMQAHIYCGYFVVATFALHTQFTLPDTGLEWVLWLLFVLVAVSGVVGAFLARAIPSKLEANVSQVPLEKISSQQAKIAREVDDLVVGSVDGDGAAVLTNFYTQTLHTFFRKPRNFMSHLSHSKRPLKVICGELEAFERYLDKQGKETLQSIRERIVAKDDLDFQYAHQGLLIAWLFIHIPATYGLIALSIIHVAIVHAFSSGV